MLKKLNIHLILAIEAGSGVGTRLELFSSIDQIYKYLPNIQILIKVLALKTKVLWSDDDLNINEHFNVKKLWNWWIFLLWLNFNFCLKFELSVHFFGQVESSYSCFRPFLVQSWVMLKCVHYLQHQTAVLPPCIIKRYSCKFQWWATLEEIQVLRISIYKIF